MYDRLCHGAYEWTRKRFVPALKNSQHVYRDALDSTLRAGSGRWLDLGCGHDFVPPWMSDAERRLGTDGWTVVGADADISALRRHSQLHSKTSANIQQLPFRANTFDLLTANMVLEHVERPDLFFREMSRVMRHGAMLLIHTPNVSGYTTALTKLIPPAFRASLAEILLRRRQEDVYPTYYRCNSVEALQEVARTSGLTVESCLYVDSSPQLIRVPPLMVIEMMGIRAMQQSRLSRFRPCLLATFRKR